MWFVRRLLPFAVFIISGCISVISPQTADTLDPGRMSAYAAITTPVIYAQSSKKKEKSDDDDSSDSDVLEALSIDVGTRYGLADNLDLGIEKTNLITHFDLKRRLVGTGKGFSMAVGAGVGSNNLAGFFNSKKASYFIRTSDVPLYLSTRVGQTSSLYSVLRYHYTHIQAKYVGFDTASSGSSSTSTSSTDEQSSYSARNVALSLGGVFGEPVGFFIEIAAIKGMDKENNATRPQLALGVSLLNAKTRGSQATSNESSSEQMPAASSPIRTRPAKKIRPAVD